MSDILNRFKLGVQWRFRRIWCSFCFFFSLLVGWLLGLPGCRFAVFGAVSGWRIRKKDQELASGLLITPVNCVRYFEFDFALKALPVPLTGRCLDVSSPRLFSAFILKKNPYVKLDIVNPDGRDLDETKRLIDAISPSRNDIAFHHTYADRLPWDSNIFDYIWSISVLEHIPIPDDIKVLMEIWRVLKRRGKLILTLPVMASGFEEYRDENVYGLGQIGQEKEGYFFQRWYDENSLQKRVLKVVKNADVVAKKNLGRKAQGMVYCL